MTVHHCPKCELRFERKAELDDHCRTDHPEFRHEYPASPPPVAAVPPEEPKHHEAAAPAKGNVAQSLAGWLLPARRGAYEHPAHPHAEQPPAAPDSGAETGQP
jgi:hypothetical protein